MDRDDLVKRAGNFMDWNTDVHNGERLQRYANVLDLIPVGRYREVQETLTLSSNSSAGSVVF